MKAILEAFAHLHITDPVRGQMSAAICNLMAGQPPSEKDIGSIIQGFDGHPFLCTMDLQDAIEALNAAHGTNHQF